LTCEFALVRREICALTADLEPHAARPGHDYRPRRGHAVLRHCPAGGRLDTIRLVRTAANGYPALAAYLPDQSARCHGYGIMVFTITGEGIATISGFPSPRPVREIRAAPHLRVTSAADLLAGAARAGG
jgi:hypothetical protein